MKSRSEIISDVLNYLNFFEKHFQYTIYKSESGRIDDGEFDCDNSSSVVIANGDESSINEANALKVKDSVTQYSIVRERWMDCADFDSFENEIRNCQKCGQLSKARKQIVFGTGNPDADVVVVGEAPGADEDDQGKPFVGRAGKLLTDILKAINFSRDEVFICNILKCRPPENRNPLPEEIANCEPYLFKQLEMIKPKLILALGTFAAQTLLKTKEPLGRLRGKFHQYKGVKMMVTYHPAALLRNPNWKRPTWEDVQLFRKEYDKLINE